MKTEIDPLRPELEALPSRLRTLPVYRGYPVPWFVAWENEVPEFRCADGRKFARAIEEKLCWVCGDKLGRMMTFVLGPMCGINRITAEPPCHLECAQWSARNCPFLSKPQMTRRENNMPENSRDPDGFMIKRNPGVTLLWTTRKYQLFGDGKGGILFDVGEPLSTEWWALGKPATREQVTASVESGLPLLANLAEDQAEAAMVELNKRKAWLESRYPVA